MMNVSNLQYKTPNFKDLEIEPHNTGQKEENIKKNLDIDTCLQEIQRLNEIIENKNK